MNWPFGSKVMLAWSSNSIDNGLIIILQPHMRNGCSWTFWKGASNIFNFHVGKNFIWSLYDEVKLRRKTFYFWQFPITSHLLFWETFDLTLFSPILIFEMSNETCMDMNEPFQTISHLEIHKIRHSWPQLTIVDFLRFLVDWIMTDWLLSTQSLTKTLQKDP